MRSSLRRSGLTEVQQENRQPGRMSGSGRLDSLTREHPNGRNRRVSPVGGCSVEGPLTEPTAAAQIREREPLFMCRVSDAGPPQCVSRSGAGVRKPPGKEPAGGEVAVVVYGDLTAGRLARVMDGRRGRAQAANCSGRSEGAADFGRARLVWRATQHECSAALRQRGCGTGSGILRRVMKWPRSSWGHAIERAG
jgi:hypothetical protein